MNKHLNKAMKQGFTLIELIIVIAVIGILSVIAVGQYTSYIAKAQATEAVSMLSGAKFIVADYKSNNGIFPGQANLNLIYPITSAPDINTKYIQNITASGTVSPYTIVATFKASSVSELISGKTITFTTTDEGTFWTCSSNITPKDILPISCR